MRTSTSPHLGPDHYTPAAIIIGHRTIHRIAATMLGIVFVSIGFGGLASPGFMEMHLNAAHSLIHLAVGVISMYYGLAGTSSQARSICLIIGTIYTALAFLGIAFGAPGDHAAAGIHQGADSHLLVIVPGMIELAIRDHVLHGALGVMYLASGLLAWLPGDGHQTTH